MIEEVDQIINSVGVKEEEETKDLAVSQDGSSSRLDNFNGEESKNSLPCDYDENAKFKCEACKISFLFSNDHKKHRKTALHKQNHKIMIEQLERDKQIRMMEYQQQREQCSSDKTASRRQMSHVERSHIMNHKPCCLLSRHRAEKDNKDNDNKDDDNSDLCPAEKDHNSKRFRPRGSVWASLKYLQP